MESVWGETVKRANGDTQQLCKGRSSRCNRRRIMKAVFFFLFVATLPAKIVQRSFNYVSMAVASMIVLTCDII